MDTHKSHDEFTQAKKNYAKAITNVKKEHWTNWLEDAMEADI